MSRTEGCRGNATHTSRRIRYSAEVRFQDITRIDCTRAHRPRGASTAIEQANPPSLRPRTPLSNKDHRAPFRMWGCCIRCSSLAIRLWSQSRPRARSPAGAAKLLYERGFPGIAPEPGGWPPHRRTTGLQAPRRRRTATAPGTPNRHGCRKRTRPPRDSTLQVCNSGEIERFPIIVGSRRLNSIHTPMAY